MARKHTYEFDFDNMTLVNGGNDIVLAVKGTISYTMTPSFPGSYSRGMPPEYPEPEINDVQYESLSLFLDGGKELPMIVDSSVTRDTHDGLSLVAIQEMIENSDEFYNLTEYLIENAEGDNDFEDSYNYDD